MRLNFIMRRVIVRLNFIMRRVIVRLNFIMRRVIVRLNCTYEDWDNCPEALAAEAFSKMFGF